jgi:predicted dehydrogenase
MECLLVGWSSFARRRVVPALASLDVFTALNLASAHASAEELAGVPRLGRVFDDYQRAIVETPPGLVYISLDNQAHACWVERALAHGHHVVVDKPAVTELAAAERLVAMAAERALVLAEATTYAFHPLLAEVRQLWAAHGHPPTHLTAIFTPPIPSGNFRLSKQRGGGALLDLGPYCASIGRVVWGAAPERLSVSPGRGAPRGAAGSEVETSFSVLAEYGGGRTLVGHFAFTTEYRNWLQLLGPGLAVEVPGVFSTPPERVTEMTMVAANQVTTRLVPAASAMRLFLGEVLRAIASADFHTLAQTLLDDARVLDRLRQAARAES